MAASKARHYFLVPNFILRKIELGDIIIDPYNPHTVLTTASEGNFPPLPEPRSVVISEYALKVSEESALSFQVQLSSTFGGGLGVGVGGDTSKHTESEYLIPELDTVFYNSLKLEDVVPRVVHDERVWAKMRGKRLFRRSKPVYIVTGVKIARDMRVKAAVLGSEKGKSQKAAVSERFSIRGEVVIAYRISKIETRTGKAQDLRMEDFTSSSAFM